MKKLYRIICNIILCLRFPFLYPRNRWTDKHYNNWDFHMFHVWSYKAINDYLTIHFEKQDKIDLNKLIHFTTIGDTLSKRTYVFYKTQDYIAIVKDRFGGEIIFKKNLNEVLSKGQIYDVGFIDETPVIIVSDDYIQNENFVRFITITYNKWLKRIIEIADWIHDNPLQWIHCIPSYTELDALPSGWRKKFGIQLCKDIKKALCENCVKDWRITQIKEKSGYLNIYCNYHTVELDKVISKYEQLSKDFCIVCGKPTKYLTARSYNEGYMEYLCEDCIEESQKKKAYLISDLNKKNND